MPENANRLGHLQQHLARSAQQCAERDDLDQAPPPGLKPCQRLCVRCGRVTGRRDTSGLPWCGGDPVTAAGVTREIAPARWASASGPLVAA